MSQASSSKIQKYDVFLSFSGEDTRKTFLSHLYNALIQARINVFKDDERLKTGKLIGPQLLKAIKESKIAIVIFSKHFASSKWCLYELEHIMKCRKELKQEVYPIFYDVKPSYISHQNPSFAVWRDEFAMFRNIPGFDLENYRDEADCIKMVVRRVKSYIESGDDDQRGMPAGPPILTDGGKVSFSRDKKTGKNCFMIAARGLEIQWSHNPEYWQWISYPDSNSRFAEVAKLKRVIWLDIRGKIETGRLSKKTKYVAYLVFKLENNVQGLETVRAVVRFVDFTSEREAEQQASVVHFTGRGPRATLPFKRYDGWMELKMGDFFNNTGADGDVEARLMETVHEQQKRGLIVQGVEFRPE